MGIDRDEYLSRRRPKFVVDRSTAVGDYVRVSGLDDAMRALRELPRKLRTASLRKALRAAGNVIRREAQANAPVLQSVTKHRLRGLVRRSITVRGSRLARKRGDLGVYVTVRKLSKQQITAGKAAGFGVGQNPRDPFYFRFLEMGTKKMAARSFIGPALQSKSKEATDAFSTELRRAIAVENARR
jgi:HK97 gp10 family phage protein